MFEKLELIKKRYDELTGLIAQPDIIAEQSEWQRLVKEHSGIHEIVEQYIRYLTLKSEGDEYAEVLNTSDDSVLIAIAKEEIGKCREELDAVTEELKALLLPKDPSDDKNVVMEIRPAAGGDEAALFGTELMRMYFRFAERMRWKVEEIDVSMSELGGVKEAVFLISSKGAYSKLKYESGVHRVQRVPQTESQGRVHTSTVTVAVLPEADDVDVDINEKDLRIDTYRSSGAGGQHVNKTESAIRITHIPTGIVVTCQDQKSQIKNKEKAMQVLKSRLYEFFQGTADRHYADERKSQVGTGMRNERIRTYNFPQGRVTDHRINMTLYSIDAFMDGEIFDMLEALQLAAKNNALAAGEVD